jgi:hypothetical protein
MVSLKEVKVRWVQVAFNCYYKGEIVAAKVTTGNVHDTKPLKELA